MVKGGLLSKKYGTLILSCNLQFAPNFPVRCKAQYTYEYVRYLMVSFQVVDRLVKRQGPEMLTDKHYSV